MAYFHIYKKYRSNKVIATISNKLISQKLIIDNKYK